jgi:hypothetical protein
MSLALATKGILPDFTGTGSGTGPGETVYVLEEFNVEVAHEDLGIEITQIGEISLDISEIGVIIDLDQDQAEIVVSEDDNINIEV